MHIPTSPLIMSMMTTFTHGMNKPEITEDPTHINSLQRKDKKHTFKLISGIQDCMLRVANPPLTTPREHSKSSKTVDKLVQLPSLTKSDSVSSTSHGSMQELIPLSSKLTGMPVTLENSPLESMLRKK